MRGNNAVFWANEKEASRLMYQPRVGAGYFARPRHFPPVRDMCIMRLQDIKARTVLPAISSGAALR